MSSHGLMTTYAPLPVTFEKGEGIWLYDTEGNKYLDAIMGIAVCGLGHCHPKVTQTIAEQSGRLVHTSNLYHIKHQETLGEKLAEISGMDACFICNSGAEANEAAIKLARLHGHAKGIDMPAIIVTDGAFHGRTLATLTASGSRKVQAGFEPLVQGFVRAPFNDVEAIRTIAKNNTNIAAILVEPVQGEGGIRIPDDGYLKALREICNEQDWLLMLDEVQTGNGRTGQYFAYQHEDVTPDVVTTAKGLGNGMPIGACLAKGQAAALFKPGNHGSTYGGNPLACATALTVMDTLVSENLCERAQHLGQMIRNGLTEALIGSSAVTEIRGKGLMLGIELKHNCPELALKAMKNGLLINVTSNNVIRLLPALTMTDDEARLLVDRVALLVNEHF